ncbi:MAG: ABC transporter substrate-binding protein, partial [Gemmobacter sp.]|nr:ABC transporter substrate-binding protein [Gemmobacter sp.]
MKHVRKLLLSGACALGAMTGTAMAQDCEIAFGSVLSLTGANAAIGKAIGDAGQLAVDQFNEAGGAAGCKVRFVLRDDLGQPNVGVDAAKSLVEIEKSPVILGAISSGVTLPILTSVAVPSKVTQISCCSSAPSLTALAAEGGTDGLWFRTVPTSRPQGIVMATLAHGSGLKSMAIVYVNSDYGVGLARDFKEAFEALGGTISQMVAYNEQQPSYRVEVNSALQGEPEALFLVAFPADGATVAREWLSFGGSSKLYLSNAMRADEFVQAVGADLLVDAVGIDNAQISGDSVTALNAAWEERFGSAPNGPGLHSMYDATAVALLAMEKAGEPSGRAIADSIRTVTGGEGEVVFPGIKGFTRAKALIAAGAPFTYVGATGPITFDANGDVNGPYLIWGARTACLPPSTPGISRVSMRPPPPSRSKRNGREDRSMTGNRQHLRDMNAQFSLDGVSDLPLLMKRRAVAAQAALARWPCRRALRYGPGPGETLNLFPPAQPQGGA